MFSDLTQLADFYINLPVSSAEVERVFSLLNDLEDADRLNMSDESICSHLMICANGKFVKEVWRAEDTKSTPYFADE